jgi:lysophospholipase L1-like esterase
MSRAFRFAVILAVVLLPSVVWAQIDFPKTGYYAAMGDSVAAGEGNMPVTNGYAYQLYDQGVFGQKQAMDFSNLAVRGARSWDLRDHQVAQLLCATPRPNVVTITAGANDFLRGDGNIFGIASRVVEAVNILLNNGTPLVPPDLTVLDPITGLPCPRLTNVTILVSNYYRIPHPIPAIAAQLDMALQGFDLVLSALLPLVPLSDGSRVEKVDLYAPSLGRVGLVVIERRLGFEGPINFDVHPTNLGHTFIAQQFKEKWLSLQ